MLRILVVDDDPAVLRVLKAGLSSDGHEVAVASDGLEALAIHEKDPADLIVLDVVMPRFDGFEVLRKLRNDNDQVPVLFLSGLTDVKDRLQGFSLGADDYLVKPFSMTELRLRVNGILRRSIKSSLQHV